MNRGKLLGIAGALVVSTFLPTTYAQEDKGKPVTREFSFTDKKGKEYELTVVGTPGDIDYRGENIYKEPDYVKWHFWTIVEKDWLSTHSERQPALWETMKDIKDNENNPKHKIKREAFIDAEEYIEFENGNSLGLMFSNNGDFYLFFVGKQVDGYYKEELDRNPEKLMANQRKLYDLVRLTNKDIKEIKKQKDKRKEN